MLLQKEFSPRCDWSVVWICFLYCIRIEQKPGSWEAVAAFRTKVIHPKYYKHLKKGAPQSHVWADKKWSGFNTANIYIENTMKPPIVV